MLKQLLAVLLALSLSLALLTGLVWLLGTNAPLMLSLMRRYAPSETTALPDAEYPAMADMITAYLRGDSDTFQLVFDMDGTDYLAFRSHEQQHMADCRALFVLARQVSLGALGLSALLTLLLWRLRHRPGRARKGFVAALLTLLALVGAAALWAVMDFDSAFVLFHRLSFTNELWLLNPRTDLLIRLMPTAFFMHYAALLGLLWLAGMLLLLLAGLIHRKEGKTP